MNDKGRNSSWLSNVKLVRMVLGMYRRICNWKSMEHPLYEILSQVAQFFHPLLCLVWPFDLFDPHGDPEVMRENVISPNRVSKRLRAISFLKMFYQSQLQQKTSPFQASDSIFVITQCSIYVNQNYRNDYAKTFVNPIAQ